MRPSIPFTADVFALLQDARRQLIGSDRETQEEMLTEEAEGLVARLEGNALYAALYVTIKKYCEIEKT
jgi:hypothetical protein